MPRQWIKVSALLLSLCLSALAAGLGGCAAPLPRLAPALPAQWQHALTLSKKPTDLHGWWHAFADRDLDRLVERALGGNLDVAQARERLLAVRALNQRSRAPYLPALRASTTDVIDPDASASYFLVGFDASWELGLFGRAEGSRREAQGALNAGVADLRSAQVSLVAEVVRTWINLRTSQKQLELLTHITQTRRHALQMAQVRQRLHLLASSSVDQSQAALAQSMAAQSITRQTIDASAQQLALLLGQNHTEAAWLQPGTPPELGDWQIDGTPADLLRTRPEIAHAEAEVLQAAGAQALAHADQFPRIGLGGSINWSTDINNNHKRSSTPNAIGSFGPEISVPLFDWGLRLAIRHGKDHELKASVLAYRQAVLQGVTEVEVALASLQRQQQREEQQALAWQALQRAGRSMRTRIGLQLESPLDGVEGDVATAQAGIELADARAAHSLAFVALYKALGGAPLPPSDASAEPVATRSSSAKAQAPR